MSEPRWPPSPSIKAAVALLLTFAPGCVDVIGFLSLYHIFTAHMTGTTVHLGQDLMNTRLGEACKTASVMAAFLGGSVVGRAVIEVGARRQVRRVASAVLLIEAAIITAVVPLARHTSVPSFLLPAMLAAAMGTQTATLTRIGSLTVHTTSVTGMVNKLAQLLSHGAFLTYDVLRGRRTTAHGQRVFLRAGFMFSIWVLYLLGAITGTWLNSACGIKGLLLPAGVVVIIIIVDQVTPLSLAEEREESDR